MKLVKLPGEMQALAEDARIAKERIALVPTMGYLHEGHLSLMREARRRATLVVVSIFVNPTQFGPAEDLSRYPRDLDRDLALMRPIPVDVVFAPEPPDVYRESSQTWVEVAELTKGLCGRHRPGHFRGVTTVVAKLFNIVKPHLALFGAKDYQQLRAIQQMVADLNFDVEIVPMPTVREADGLAMSSRNAFLSPEDRKSALALSLALNAAKNSMQRGARSAIEITTAAIAVLEHHPQVRLEYLEVLDAETLETPSVTGRDLLVAVAARVGNTRLIDNVVLKSKGQDLRAATPSPQSEMRSEGR